MFLFRFIRFNWLFVRNASFNHGVHSRCRPTKFQHIVSYGHDSNLYFQFFYYYSLLFSLLSTTSIILSTNFQYFFFLLPQYTSKCNIERKDVCQRPGCKQDRFCKTKTKTGCFKTKTKTHNSTTKPFSHVVIKRLNLATEMSFLS